MSCDVLGVSLYCADVREWGACGGGLGWGMGCKGVKLGDLGVVGSFSVSLGVFWWSGARMANFGGLSWLDASGNALDIGLEDGEVDGIGGFPLCGDGGGDAPGFEGSELVLGRWGISPFGVFVGDGF